MSSSIRQKMEFHDVDKATDKNLTEYSRILENVSAYFMAK